MIIYFTRYHTIIKMKRSRNDLIFDIVNMILLSIIALIFLIPFIYVVSGSLMSQKEFLERGYSLFPKGFDFSAYKIVLSKEFGLIRGYKDTIIITVLGTILKITFEAAMGYGLAKKTLPGRNFITGIVFFTMLFSGGMIPTYLVVRETGLFNTYWAFIIPALVSPWNMFLFRNFFMAIPESLEEAAKMDGANEIKIFYKMILPLSKPVLATVALFHSVGLWNIWFENILYVPKENIQTLQYILKQILSNQMSERLISINALLSIPTKQIQLSAIIVSMLPILVLYPFLQRYFVRGVMVGSVKG